MELSLNLIWNGKGPGEDQITSGSPLNELDWYHLKETFKIYYVKLSSSQARTSFGSASEHVFEMLASVFLNTTKSVPKKVAKNLSVYRKRNQST